MTTRSFLLVALAATALGCEKPEPAAPLGKSTVPPNRPTTVKALADAELAALQAKNPDQAVDLVVTVFDIGRTCPKLNPKFLSHREKLIADTRAGFEVCEGLVDWATAKVLEVKGGEPSKAAPACEGAQALDDIFLTVEAGGKKVEVKLDDPLGINGVVVLGEPGPTCKLAD